VFGFRSTKLKSEEAPFATLGSVVMCC